MRRRDGGSPDPVGGILSLLLLLLLAIVVAAQIGLAHHTWRPRLSLIETLEGVPLAEKDLPSAAGLW